ncbi:MAG: hypothetical protein ACO3IT_07345 [Ilumatobacteraceae bacterium]
MAQASVDILAGSQGFKRYGTGTVTSVSWDAVVPQEDTVFTSFTVQYDYQTAADVLSTRGMSGVTFQQGAYLPAGKGAKITGFVISSGSVVAY